MKLIDITCPNCGATFNVDREHKECFCVYCGTKILLDDGSRTVTHIHIDKTKEKELELSEKQLQYEQERHQQEKKKKIYQFVCFIIAIVFIAITTIWVMNMDRSASFYYVLMYIGCGIAVARLFKRTGKVYPVFWTICIVFLGIMYLIIFKSDQSYALMWTLGGLIVPNIIVSCFRKS